VKHWQRFAAWAWDNFPGGVPVQNVFINAFPKPAAKLDELAFRRDRERTGPSHPAGGAGWDGWTDGYGPPTPEVACTHLIPTPRAEGARSADEKEVSRRPGRRSG
jgi:hypothetical protein